MNDNPGVTEEGPLFKQVLLFFDLKNSAAGFLVKPKVWRVAIFTRGIMKRLSTAVTFVFDRDELLKAEGERYAWRSP